MALLHALSSIPGVAQGDDPLDVRVFVWLAPELQNLLHIPAYALLAWVWCWSLPAWGPSRAVIMIAAVVLAGLFGLVDEWHQTFVPGRYGSATDLALDLLGAILGVWLASRVLLPSGRMSATTHRV